MTVDFGLIGQIAAIVIVGGGLIILIRFARRQNDQLRAKGIVDWRDAITRPPAGVREWLAFQFFGPSPKPIEVAGRGLVLVTTIVLTASIIALLVVVAVAIWRAHA
jgi:hypothetical protein